MKYLSKEPFTIAVSSPNSNELYRLMERASQTARQLEAKRPHEYLNGGVMCQICGLAQEAAIHETKN